MTTVDNDETCTRCGDEIMVQFDCRTGEYARISMCSCDVVEKQLRSQIRRLKRQIEKVGVKKWQRKRK